MYEIFGGQDKTKSSDRERFICERKATERKGEAVFQKTNSVEISLKI